MAMIVSKMNIFIPIYSFEVPAPSTPAFLFFGELFMPNTRSAVVFPTTNRPSPLAKKQAIKRLEEQTKRKMAEDDEDERVDEIIQQIHCRLLQQATNGRLSWQDNVIIQITAIH